MGRIKTQLTKRLTLEVVSKYKDKLTNNFDENKKVVGDALSYKSKKIRNIIAGYATRLMKNKEEL